MAQKKEETKKSSSSDSGYTKLRNEIAATPKRNLNGSLEQCKEELRDAYMNFVELQKRCVVEIPTKDKTDKPVYYFQPDTFLLDHPDRQRYFRESLLNKISAMPKPEPINYLGDEMHRQFLSTVADQSRPTITKKNLAMFFKRRQYAMQHLKYKLLCRWAHFSMNAQQLDTGKDAVFLFGKVEYSIEQAMNRVERLSQEDYFDQALPGNRPNTKADQGEGSLYVENVDLEPQSLLREDDIEIFTRSTSYRNKVSKLVNKFMSRLKWLPMLKRYEIYEAAIASKHKQKQANIKAQFDFIDQIDARARERTIVTSEVENELNDILNCHYVRMHALMYTSQSEKIANSWRSDHDNVPNLINNQHELKIQILNAAQLYDIKGDIELDHGYSFSYRVTVKFPQYFQRQCIKSQFSLYDVFATEDDKNQVQKHTLTNMTRIDTSIFKDVSTTPNLVPDAESLAFELRNENIKVIRLKSCAYWLDYICMLPTEPEWHQKQQAILNNDNPIDTLTRSGMNFLDVSDLASVNQINEDNALLHQQTVRKLQALNPHNMVVQKMSNQANEGEKKFAFNLQDFNNSANEAHQINKHIMNAVQGGGISSEMGGGARSELQMNQEKAANMATAMSRSGLRSIPQHLLVSFFTLRYMKSRDYKTKILYALNFCRAIQKRLSLDLREFGTRERIDSHLNQPYHLSTDADKKVVTNVNLSKNPYEGSSGEEFKTTQRARAKDNKALDDKKYEKMSVFDQDVIQNMKTMASVRMYKVNGTFNNKVFSTCPSVPKFHCTFGEPTMRQTEDMEMDSSSNRGGISKQSLKLMGRVDHIELDEVQEEVYVKDDFGVYILYDCVLQDMKGMEEELIKICSYYINKAEVLQDVHTEKPQPAKDRLQTLCDLLECEASFQFKKTKLCMAYVECYEHVVDPLEQQRLMQVIIDVMSRRPRLNLQANYFTDSYFAENECLDNQLELVKLLIKTQIDLERSANKTLQDSLQLSYTLCNQYEENRWKYQDVEELLAEVLKREKQEKARKQYQEVMLAKSKRMKKENFNMRHGVAENEGTIEEDSAAESSNQSRKQKSDGQNSNAEVATKVGNDDMSDGDDGEIDSDMSELDLINGQDNMFQQLLGLPEISIETLYMASKEKDKTILHLMNEHANFVQIHEGYPEFLNFQQGGTNGAAVRNFKVNPWSEPTANLDFYDSLSFINKFASITTQIQQELYDALKPYDPTVMTYIDSHVAQFALQEFHRVIKVMEGAETEYENRQYIEDESIMGNPDKMVFYAKEMISNLTMTPKSMLDPYIMAKMDVNTVNHFDFARLPKSENKYNRQFQDGVKPAEWVVTMYKQALVQAAIRKSAEKIASAEEVVAGKPVNQANIRNVAVPSMLTTYCNMLELMRLRHEIILAASECAVLQQIYMNQAQQCNLKGCDVFLADSISFEAVDLQDDQSEVVNFFDEGTSHSIKIGLAVSEYDPCLLSNFNFRNPDTFKVNITDAGLEEVRSVLTYQLLQKHLLIVATRLNQLLIDNSMKAISEVNLLQRLSVATPNSTFDVNSVFSRNADNLSTSLVKEVRLRFSQNMSNSVANIFYNVTQKKQKMRTDIAKEYSNYLSKVSRVHPVKNASVQRIMRSFKVKQLVRYCEAIILEVHLDAQKVQAVQVCQRLRTFSQYFSFDPAHFGMSVIQRGKPGEPRKEDYQVFEYETSRLIENFTYPYMPQEEEENQLDGGPARREIKAIDPASMNVVNIGAIPSSASLLACESSSAEEMRNFKERLTKIHKAYNSQYEEDLRRLDESTNEPERQTKEMLPTMTHRDPDPSQGKGKPEDSEVDKLGYPLLDYEEALNFGTSKFAVMTRFYQYLERILNLEWFITKLQFRQDTVVHMDNAINLGLPFWADTGYERRMKKEIVNLPIREGVNPIAQDFLHSNIIARQTKKNIAEEVGSMSMTIQSLLKRYTQTKAADKYEYLNSYTEFRYMQILGSFHKIIQQFYIQRRGGNGIRCLREAISQLAKTDHVRISYSKGNSYHVNTGLVHPHMQLLESTNMIHGAHSEDEFLNFNRCVQPVVNEKALEPPQLTLFQSLYQTDSFRKRLPTQFAGQLVSSHNAWSFKSLDTALLEMSIEDRTYAQSFIMQAKDQATDVMEIVGDPSLASMSTDDVYSLSQLADAKKFLADTTQALLLKNAIICWNENQVLPDSAAVYAKFEEHFRNQFFWKIVEQKENVLQTLALRGDSSGIPSKAQLLELQQKIDGLQGNYSLATATEEEHQSAMIKSLREEFRAQKKKVTLDGTYSTKAEIMVLSNEIEKLITRASVQTLDAEHAALSRCFTLSQPKIQMRIHPFQQFAATLYDRVDVQYHLDMVVKLGFVQEYLTKLGNRGTDVETLTSGPGIVFTKKDFNDAIQNFCRKVIIYGEKELKSRCDLFFQKEEHYLHLIYVKDQKVEDMERRIKNTSKNIENIISAKLFEKGNQLIYQLDSTSRLLILFKQTIFGLESEIRNKILGEQAQKFKLAKDALDTQIEKLQDYKSHVSQIVGEKFSSDYEQAMTSLKNQVAAVWNIDPDTSTYVPPTLYPATGGPRYRNPIQQIVIRHESRTENGKANGENVGGSSVNPAGGGYAGRMPPDPSEGRVIKDLALETVGTLPGSVVPEGFQHYSHCSCFQPSKMYPNYSLENAELEMYSEQEARFELARVCEVMRKQRLFWRTKEMLMKQKYQNKINLMKKQLSNNAYLWDQMAESEKRESILKQELLFTQQSLSAAEKVIEKLQEEMKKVEADRQRLYKYKHSKAERLKELEDKIKKFEVYENIDTDKLISVLGKKDEECKQLQGIADNFSSQVNRAEQRKMKEVHQYKDKLVHEQVKTQQVVEKMEQMKLELKMLESNDTSVASIWKKKCLDLFEVCQTLKGENEELRDRCKELIVQGIQLADAVNRENDHQNLILDQPQQSNYNSSQPAGPNLSLPKLPSNTSVQRINRQASGANKPAPGTTGPISGRFGSSTANTYDYASAVGGFPVENNRLQNKPFDEVTNPDESALGNQFQLLSQYTMPGQQTAQRQSPEKSYAVTMNAAARTAGFPVAKGVANKLRAPQLEPMNVQTGKAVNVRYNLRKGGPPQTQHQPQRGKTVSGAAGPTYYMPGTTVPVGSRPGQYTRQKGRHQMRSILASAGAVKDVLAESSFNQSFRGSTDQFATTGRTQVTSPRQAWGNAPLQPTSPHQPITSRNDPKGRTMQATSGQQPPAYKYFNNVEKHNDSLFESSKASTNNQTSIVRRQFNKGKANRTAINNALIAQKARPTEMLGTAVFGSKIGQPGIATQQSTAIHGSTKDRSQITSEQQYADPRLPTTEQNTTIKKVHNLPGDSQLAEASFAAPQAPNKQVIMTPGSSTNDVHLTNYVSDEVTKMNDVAQ